MISTDILCDLASAIVERQHEKDNREMSEKLGYTLHHSYTADNGDIIYREEVQQEFIEVLDLIDEIVNGGELGDYTHCKACDVVIDIEKDKWQIINDNTFCKDCARG